ncbi:MAG: DinB family protein [Caldilineaceae bacterium]|nr:DinB family protein [Caldilineaceae bacterium]
MANAISILRAQYKQSAEWFEGTMAGLDVETAHYQPGGLVAPISAQAAHMVSGLDFLILGTIAGRAPLMMSSHAETSGISEPPPRGEWLEWAQRLEVDLSALHEYSKAVFAAVDDYLASLSDDDLDRDVESDFGTFTVAWWLNTMLLNNYSHTGEIAAIKGFQGLKGYPV